MKYLVIIVVGFINGLQIYYILSQGFNIATLFMMYFTMSQLVYVFIVDSFMKLHKVKTVRDFKEGSPESSYVNMLFINCLLYWPWVLSLKLKEKWDEG